MNKFDPNLESILFLNGGGQIPFSPHNKLVKLFDKYGCNLVAVELPGHGKSVFHKTMGQDEFLDNFKSEFQRIISMANVTVKLMIGFSLGGLFSLKAVELKLFPVEFLLVYGCGFGIGAEEKPTFEYYTSEQFFDHMRWLPIMKKNHERGWKHLLLSMQNLMQIDSMIFSDISNISTRTQILLILGEDEELFHPDFNRKMFTSVTKNSIDVVTLPNTSHFDYTTVSWSEFCTVIENFIENNNWFDN